MADVKSTRVDQTETQVVFTPSEVKSILEWAALETVTHSRYGGRALPWSSTERSCGLGRTTKLSIEQVKEGSPEYSVQKWRATVDVTEDHRAVAVAPPERAES